MKAPVATVRTATVMGAMAAKVIIVPAWFVVVAWEVKSATAQAICACPFQSLFMTDVVSALTLIAVCVQLRSSCLACSLLRLCQQLV